MTGQDHIAETTAHYAAARIQELEAENARLREEWAQEGIGWLRDKDIDRLMAVEDENKRLRETLTKIVSGCQQTGKDARHNYETVRSSRRHADQRSAAYCEGILRVTDVVALIAKKGGVAGFEPAI